MKTKTKTKTKTIHRIPADKVVIEDDRRVDSLLSDKYYMFGPQAGRLLDRRILRHYYDQKQKYKIVSFPVEPQPLVEGEFKYRPFRKTWTFYPTNNLDIVKHSRNYVDPFHPDDTLILMEEWKDEYLGMPHLFLPNSKFQGTKEPASTMPPELDSQCQQLTVVKRLGVEQLPDHVFEEKKDWPWMGKLLANYLEI